MHPSSFDKSTAMIMEEVLVVVSLSNQERAGHEYA
jgi:hypothetical protein